MKKSEAKLKRKTKATPKQVWIRPMHSASAAFSRQEDKNEEIEKNQQMQQHLMLHFTWKHATFLVKALSTVCVRLSNV